MFFLSLLLACSENTPDFFEGFTDGESYFVQVKSNPTPIPFNEYFSLEIQAFEDEDLALALEDVTVSVNATMPSHGHGMNENPVLSGPENGIFFAEGLKWHMEGEWELLIFVETEKASFTVECCTE